MRIITALTFIIFNLFCASANKYDAMWNNVSTAQNKDLPRDAMEQLRKIANIAKSDKEYGEYLAAELTYSRIEAEVTPDSLTPAIIRLVKQAADIKSYDAALYGVYNAIIAQLCTLVKDDAVEDITLLTAEEYYDKALSNPDVLAQTKTNAYKRLVIEGQDDIIYNNDLLSLIGHTANRYEYLEDYYYQHGNKRAACIERILRIEHGRWDLDDRSITICKRLIDEGMMMYADYSESILLANAYYELLHRDNDTTEKAIYDYLVRMINGFEGKYADGELYLNVLRNNLLRHTASQYNLNIGDSISLHNIRNVNRLEIEFTKLDADGRTQFKTYKEDWAKKALKLSTGFTRSIVRTYDNPIWQTHDDSAPLPDMPYGVYLVKTSNGKQDEYSLYKHTDLSVMSLGIGEDNKCRIIVASRHTGAPIANANILLTEEQYGDKIKKQTTLTTDAKGEAIFSGSFRPNRVWVSLNGKDGKPIDNAFEKNHFNTWFKITKYRTEKDDIKIFTDRSLYRPGQTLKVAIVVYNSATDEDTHSIAAKEVCIRIRNAKNEEIHKTVITTDTLGNAGIEYVLPNVTTNGSFSIEASGVNCNSNTAYVRVEEYKRPTFELNVENKEDIDKTIFISKDNPTDSVEVSFKATTYSQMPVQNASVTYSVKRRKPYFWWRNSDEEVERTVIADTQISTNDKGITKIGFVPTLPENDYRRYVFTVRVSVTDMSGETHELSQPVYVQRLRKGQTAPDEEKEPERPKPDYELSHYVFPADGTVTLTVRDNEPGKTYLYYTIFAGKQILENDVAIFNKEYERKFAYKTEYEEGLSLAYVFIKNGHVHQYKTTIAKPEPDLRLPMRWSSFRDKTTPGSMETWTMKIGNAKNTPLSTLCATIYDKSLDAIMPLSWAFGIYRGYYDHSANWSSALNSDMFLRLYVNEKEKASKSSFDYAMLNRDCLPYLSYYSRYNRHNTVYAKGMLMGVGAVPMMVEEKVYADESDSKAMAKKENVMRNNAGGGNEEPTVDLSAMVRTDIGETAFFTPSLLSDADGNISISFQMPETMTTWRIRGMVHDSKMKFAMIDTTCVVSKDIIVKPNVPRFLRENDRAVFAATVANTTDNDVNTEVVMQLLIPETKAIVWQKKQRVSISARNTASVMFESPEVSCDSLLVYRVAATTDDGVSDGEQHYIPVLPASEIVSSTMAFTQHNVGVLSRDISGLFLKDSSDRSIRVKYTPHAIRMIMDAIPVVTHPDHKDALSLASACYVASLFNSNDSLRVSITNELMQLQLRDGAWAWWKGMDGSVFITTAVARLLARLEYNGFGDDVTTKMLTKSLPFVLKHAKDEAKYLRNYKKKHPKAHLHPSETTTDILYILSLASQAQNKKAEELLKNNVKDINFLLDLLENAGTEMTIYGKANTALLLSHYGRMKKAMEHLESLKQYSVCTEEAGRYYDSPKAYYSWRNYRIPTEVAAIEALMKVTPKDTMIIDEMKRWLLHEKRTQQWDSSVNTADAVYAFMLGNESITDETTDDFSISLDGNVINNDSVMATSGARMLEVDKRTTGTSWGAVFVSQRAPLSSIQTRGDGFKIKRQILLTEKKTLSVGDRVTIRLIIDADRDYDCVEVCDNRAACLEPIEQISGYRSAVTGGTARGSYSGYYRITHDNRTEFFFDRLAKGTHIIDTEYYVDRTGLYQQGSCTVKCSYAPEFSALSAAETLEIKK